MVRRLGAVLVAVAMALVGCGADDPPDEGADDTRGAVGCSHEAVRLAFSVAAGEGGDVMALRADGDVVALTDDGGSFSPAVSPDGSHVASSSIGPDGSVSDTTGPEGLGIEVVAADGSDRRRLVDGGESLAPAWSPDGLTIAYAHQGSIGAPSEIWVVGAAEGGVGTERLITPDPGRADSEPAWSPDGERIAFVRGGVDLMVANADGTDVISVHRDPDSVSSISWAPDGTRLLVAVGLVTERGGRIGVVDVATGEVSIVSGSVRAPWWSASGRLYGLAVPPAIVDPTGGMRVSELELDDDGAGTASGRAVVEVPTVGALPGDAGVSTPACDAGAPALTDPDDVPETLTVEHPVTREETVVITRDQAEDLIDTVTEPDLGSDVEVTSRLVYVEEPVGDFEEGLPELVWVVGADVAPPDEVVGVFDATSGAHLGSSTGPDEEPWASWPDLAPPP